MLSLVLICKEQKMYRKKNIKDQLYPIKTSEVGKNS